MVTKAMMMMRTKYDDKTGDKDNEYDDDDDDDEDEYDDSRSDPSSFTWPQLPSVMQSSVASTICSGKADGASPLTIIMPAPWEPAVWTCTVLADGETPSVEGDLPNLTNVASLDSSSTDLPMDFP
jgi:hypothetical protein